MKHLLILLLTYGLLSCNNTQKPMHVNRDYTVYNNKVVQGKYIAEVKPDGSITSNYASPGNELHKRTIELKFSINNKDNELPFGKNHKIVVTPQNGVYTTPLITFGKQYTDSKADINEVLELNTTLQIKLDMSRVFKEFETTGYYKDTNGEKISKNDFKGVFLAGNITPLNFDFENLNEDVKLKDEDGDHIYELSVKINTHDPDKYVKPFWKLSEDISQYPQLKTNNPLIQSLYNMALEETRLLSEDDGTFRTGAKWAGVWTRDVSYAIVLGMGIADTQRARTSLLKKVKRNRIVQDTGSGGAWPVSSDRTTWSLAAWELYLITGDQQWLEFSYQVIRNTIEDDRKVVYNNKSGLYRGESSFLDWRTQTYPRWMDNVDIYQSQNLGTNMVHYKTLLIASEMASILNHENDQERYYAWSENLKTAINNKLWNEEKGYYNQYIYGRNHEFVSPKSEALGEAFSVLYEVADNKAGTVIKNTPVVSWGIPCVYPQIPEITPYHNNGIWPFVQTFWNLAIAKTGNSNALEHGISAFYRAAAMFLTNKENMVAENGDFMTALNSDRQLWSVAGNLGHIYKIFFGMNFTTDSKIWFTPSIPKSYNANMELSNLKIRNKDLNIKIHGYGNKIKSFRIDGKKSENHFISLLGQGKHIIEIEMANNDFYGEYNLVPNKFHITTPEPKIVDTEIIWDAIPNAVKYEIYKDGSLYKTTTDITKASIDKEPAEYTVRAMDIVNTPSFISEPIYSTPQPICTFNNYSADKTVSIPEAPTGIIELSKTRNTTVNWKANCKKEGNYVIYFRYTNGSGPWNTDNKCAIRTLWIDNQKVAPVIMAQRGTNEWKNLGESNRVDFHLSKGTHAFKLTFEPENENMNVDTNTALLGEMILERK
ncbi:hypothetical protein [Plebeiibacterium marinum]|uniref:Alpha-L-rhamnosidase six-hairpin glycosidase domain-containing protein n=1 Tax=Plebeiibacterium marinum TaxID=2992111 RepID=A0AAE3MG81_9BACT|nr:hypothetical protein [Plebeiobacterium marinum]MCW3807268.1 hypothetical protein [Plebeiobacterium marinum]